MPLCNDPVKFKMTLVSGRRIGDTSSIAPHAVALVTQWGECANWRLDDEYLETETIHIVIKKWNQKSSDGMFVRQKLQFNIPTFVIKDTKTGWNWWIQRVYNIDNVSDNVRNNAIGWLFKKDIKKTDPYDGGKKRIWGGRAFISRLIKYK